VADQELSLGGFPSLALGDGPPLLYLAGLAPDTGVPNGLRRRVEMAPIRPFGDEHRVFYLNRRPGLPRGMSMADLAAEHAEAVRGAFPGAVDVIGLSTGGSIAQQLAADHPDVVGRLVLVSTACRLGALGRSTQRRVAARVRGGAPRQALAVLMADLVPPGRGQLAAGALGWLLGPRLGGGDLADLATTIEAEDGFDLAACAEPIRAPTLIVAGEEDRFYSPDLFEETARLIPSSRLILLAGRGHATAILDRAYPREPLRFLAGDRAA
jgi:pimeloyl-ACP methyl ester carboxylesterase